MHSIMHQDANNCSNVEIISEHFSGSDDITNEFQHPGLDDENQETA